MDRIIVWRVTQNCNMKCLFCSYSCEVSRLRQEANPEDAVRLIHILGEYKRRTGGSVLTSWIGGEPFLYEHVFDFSRLLDGEYGIKSSATTNGLCLGDKKIRDCIVNHFSEIVFSLDSFAQCNDRVRQHGGHFETVCENIEKLNREINAVKSDAVIKVNTILMRENIGAFEEFCGFLNGVGVRELTFNQLGGYDRPEFFGDNRLLPEQVKKFTEELPLIKERFAKQGLLIHGSAEYLKRFAASAEDKCISVDDCNPGKWFWFINENGFISPCSYTSYEYKLHINDIKTADDIAGAEEVFRGMRRENRSKWCDNCHCTQVYDKFE